MASDPNHRRIHAFLAAAAVVVIVLLAASKGADAKEHKTKGAVSLRNCGAYNGNILTNGACPACAAYNDNKFNPGACPAYKGVTIPKGGVVNPSCKAWGSPVGPNNNRWWLFVFYHRGVGGYYYTGWIPDHYVDCDGKLCNYPQCKNKCCSSSSGKYLP